MELTIKKVSSRKQILSWAILSPIAERVQQSLNPDYIINRYKNGESQVDIAKDLARKSVTGIREFNSYRIAINTIIKEHLDKIDREALRDDRIIEGQSKGGKIAMQNRRDSGIYDKFQKDTLALAHDTLRSEEYQEKSSIKRILESSINLSEVVAIYITPKRIKENLGAPMSIEDMAKEFHCSYPEIGRSLREAEEYGIISKEERNLEKKYRKQYLNLQNNHGRWALEGAYREKKAIESILNPAIDLGELIAIYKTPERIKEAFGEPIHQQDIGKELGYSQPMIVEALKKAEFYEIISKEERNLEKKYRIRHRNTKNGLKRWSKNK